MSGVPKQGTVRCPRCGSRNYPRGRPKKCSSCGYVRGKPVTNKHLRRWVKKEDLKIAPFDKPETECIKLRNVLPCEALSAEFNDGKFWIYLDSEVLETITKYDSRFPFKHKNIYVWWILKDNLAVGWNENPSRGWSFPVAKLKKEDKKVTMKLTLLVYTCPECDYDTTFRPDKGEYIPRRINISCHWTACPSHTK